MVKGAISHYGAQTGIDLALILEHMGQEGETADGSTVLDELESFVTRLRVDLEKFVQERS